MMNAKRPGANKNFCCMNRRDFLAGSTFLPLASRRTITLTQSDEAFVEDLCRRSFRYFLGSGGRKHGTRPGPVEMWMEVLCQDAICDWPVQPLPAST